MLKSPKFYAVTAVLLSFALLRSVNGVFSLLLDDGSYILSLVPYTAGFLAAIAVMILCGRYPKDSSAEGEIVPDSEDAIETAEKPKKIPLSIKSPAVSVILVGVNFLYAAAIGSTDMPDMENLMFRCAVGVLIKPAAEEYLFRVLYLKALITRGIKPHISVILQALLFALIHDASSSPFALFAGVILGALSLRAGEKHEFKAVYAAHAVYNGILYLILFFIQ